MDPIEPDLESLRAHGWIEAERAADMIEHLQAENERLKAALMLGQSFLTEQTADNADAFEQAMIAALAPQR